MKDNIYYFGWPSFYGGADTRLAHTIKLWAKIGNLTLVPNSKDQLENKHWKDYIKSYGANCCSYEDLPKKMTGAAISMCNSPFVDSPKFKDLKSRGLKTIWSSEMMWHHKGELEGVKNGDIDIVLYTSEFQKSHLQHNYIKENPNIKSFIIDNYIDPKDFPLVNRSDKKESLSIGRVSRADPTKFIENFPLFYEHLNLNKPQFKVLGWSNNLSKKYEWFNFEPHWELIEAEKEDVLTFLSRLDIFVYPLGHTFKESWGRSTVEAMLTGCPVVVPYGHHFINYIRNGVTGFMYKTYEECRQVCEFLQNNPVRRRIIGESGRKFLIENTLNEEVHLEKWKEIFNG